MFVSNLQNFFWGKIYSIFVMMKLLRIILFPIVPIYFLVTWLRNIFYDKGIKQSESYSFPVICVGNLSLGGTGKTPMIEYLIRLLSNNNNLATLSRGYKRITNGFILADETADVASIGDEPLQFYRKFKNISVAVDENRRHGISKLRELNPKPHIILLDDAFQHRKVKAGLNILLTAYHNLYANDMVLPTGNLREPKLGAKRANIIVVTKCPTNLDMQDKQDVIRKLKPKSHQSVFFSSIHYSDKVISSQETKWLADLNKFTLVTGIANAKPLVDFLDSKTISFNHLEFGDHYTYRIKDIAKLEKLECIVTTEKDYMRLYDFESIRSKLFYLPIELKIDSPNTFNQLIKEFVN